MNTNGPRQSPANELPTLDAIAADAMLAAALPPEVLLALNAKAVAVLSALHAALLASAPRSKGRAEEKDRLLPVAEAAELLGMTEDWLYRHARRLPFVVRSGRLLRFSTQGIARYIRERQGV